MGVSSFSTVAHLPWYLSGHAYGHPMLKTYFATESLRTQPYACSMRSYAMAHLPALANVIFNNGCMFVAQQCQRLSRALYIN